MHCMFILLHSPPKIPANATLEFEVELLDFSNLQKVTEDGRIKKKVLKEGSGYQQANDGATVIINYAARVEGATKPFEERSNWSFVVGWDTSILSGLEEAV